MKRTFNVSGSLEGVSIWPECVRVGVLLDLPGRSDFMHLWSLAKVFHTCGKNCGKSSEMAGRPQFTGETLALVRFFA